MNELYIPKGRPGRNFVNGRMKEHILRGETIPQIAEQMSQYSYEQVYDTILCDPEFNELYRRHGQTKVKKRH